MNIGKFYVGFDGVSDCHVILDEDDIKDIDYLIRRKILGYAIYGPFPYQKAEEEAQKLEAMRR